MTPGATLLAEVVVFLACVLVDVGADRVAAALRTRRRRREDGRRQ